MIKCLVNLFALKQHQIHNFAYFRVFWLSLYLKGLFVKIKEEINLKGTVVEIISDPPFKKGHARLKTEPLKS